MSVSKKLRYFNYVLIFNVDIVFDVLSLFILIHLISTYHQPVSVSHFPLQNSDGIQAYATTILIKTKFIG